MGSSCYYTPCMPKKKQPQAKENPLKEMRSRISKAPTKPGIYRWIGKNDEVLYIGKAKNLKNRLKSYVQKDPDITLGPWKLALIQKITDVDWTITETELEALILETNLIKELKPKYNVLMKDDKSYVYVKINVHDPYPSVEVVRHSQMGEEDSGKKPRYFGPFLSSGHIKRTLEMLHDVYGFRACKRSLEALNKAGQALRCHGERSRNMTPDHSQTKPPNRHPSTPLGVTPPELKPCLDSQIGRCNGLCKGDVTHEDYQNKIENVMRFFRGDRKGVLERLKEKMQQAAERKLFEDAAKLRDTLEYIQSLEAQQVVSDTSGANTDVFGVAMLSEKAHVVVLRERDGRVVGERSYALAGQADTVGEVLTQFIPQYYTSTGDIPDTIICAEKPEEPEILNQWLDERLGTGRRVTLHVPERGKKSKLLKMAEENAQEKIKQHLAKWEAATQKVEDALTELKKKLKLKDKPKRIECYDISHHGGTETVGSMSVFVNGKAKNEHYRSFTIRTMKKGVIDDYKALKEVLTRRMRHLAANLKNEEEALKDQGITIGKARKDEEEIIKDIKNQHILLRGNEGVSYKDFLVARKENEMISFVRIIKNKAGLHELKSLWVAEGYRSQKLGLFLVKKILKRAKNGKVYLMTNEPLAEYYAHVGFQYVQTPSDFFREKMEKRRKKYPDQPRPLIMVFDSKQNKHDPSLSSAPDLLVLDGGKGQLSTGVEVLKEMKVDIPIIGLAKREEEVFVPSDPTPLSFKKDSEGLFLLMRARDEAHRFANWQREKKAKKGFVG